MGNSEGHFFYPLNMWGTNRWTGHTSVSQLFFLSYYEQVGEGRCKSSRRRLSISPKERGQIMGKGGGPSIFPKKGSDKLSHRLHMYMQSSHTFLAFRETKNRRRFALCMRRPRRSGGDMRWQRKRTKKGWRRRRKPKVAGRSVGPLR